MKLKETYGGGSRRYTVEEAASITLRSDRDGVAERANELAGMTGDMLARLIGEMHAAGVLTDAAALRVINGAFERADD